MDNKERVEKMIEEVRDKLSDGWQVEAVSVNRWNTEGRQVVYIELEIVKE